MKKVSHLYYSLFGGTQKGEKMHKQLTLQQRYYIFVAKERKKSILEISNEIKVHKSTIYRELKRNKYLGKIYYYKVAQNLAKNRQEKALKKASVLTAKIKEKILENLEKNWSPEQISGRLKLESFFCIVVLKSYSPNIIFVSISDYL